MGLACAVGRNQEVGHKGSARLYKGVDADLCNSVVIIACLEASTLHKPLLPGRVRPFAITYEIKPTPHDRRKALLLHDKLQRNCLICTLVLYHFVAQDCSCVGITHRDTEAV